MTYKQRFPDDPTAPPEDHAEGNGATSTGTAQLIENLKVLAGELRSHATYLVAAKLDGIKWSLTKLGMLAAIGAIALLALSAALVTGVVVLLIGIADGIGSAFGDDLRWIGWLITGLAVLAVTGGGALLGMSMLKRSTLRSMEQKYENKRQRQQSEFGHHVRDRAASGSDSV